MIANLALLILLGLAGFCLSRYVGYDPIDSLQEALGRVGLVLAVVVPLIALLPLVVSGDAESMRSGVDAYFESVSAFIANQSTEWVFGYLASAIVGAIVGTFCRS